MIDPRTEPLMTLQAAADKMPGKKVSYQTIYVWVTSGVLVGNQTVTLETVRLGRRRLTSMAAIHRFIAALTEANNAAEAITPQRNHTDARRQLAARHGI